MEQYRKQYEKSLFFDKYKDTYHSDCILKDVFAQSLRKHRLNISSKSYENVHAKNIEVMEDFLNLYWNEITHKDDKLAFQMLYSIYIDPDPYPYYAEVKTIKGIECTADGLISLKRLYAHEGISDKLVQSYELYRKKPMFFFPKEKNGINMTRSVVFGDRIDHTLFDIKRYLDAKSKADRNSCRLTSAYGRPITMCWLSEMESFNNVVDWLKIKGIFTNENYEVFDIEKGDGSIITDYLDRYPRKWSDKYYNSLKKRIELFMELNQEP